MKEIDLYNLKVKLIQTEKEQHDFFLKGINADTKEFFKDLDKQIDEVLKGV